MDTWLRLLAPLVDSDALAVVTGDGTWSGRELMRRAAGAVELLDEVGAPRGAPIVALLSGTPSAFALAIGAASSDRALAPLGPKLTPSELVPCIERLGGEVIVTEAAHEALAREVGSRTRRRVVVVGEVRASAQPLSFAVGPERPAVILHTSGTTGLPKAVPYDQHRLALRSRANAALVMLGPGALYATASPFHHIAGVGMLFAAMAAGAGLLSLPRFDVDAWQGLGARGVTHALLVPTMIEMLLDAGALALPTLRVLQYGASPIHPATLARAMDVLPGIELVNLYGQTEGSPIAALTPELHRVAARGRPELLASVGRAMPGVEITIEGPGDDGVGEVVARAVHLFKPDADGWLRTGDLGRLDAEGFLFLSGRKGDKIIRGGENIYPLEVEQVLLSHPAILEVCVYGVPDRVWGESVVAAYVVAADPDAPVDGEVLRAFARSHLASFKVPTVWKPVLELPRNMAGKVLRRELIRTHADT